MPLTRYSGTWGRPQVLHLLRRTLFGLRKEDIAFFLPKTMEQAVTHLLTVPTTAPPPPVRNYTLEIDGIPMGQTWVNSFPTLNPISLPNTPSDQLIYERLRSLRSWWLGLMLRQGFEGDKTNPVNTTFQPQTLNILEKMTLFWHNHLPVNVYPNIGEAVWCYQYVALLRRFALGNYKTLLETLTLDPAMLEYLGGNRSQDAGTNIPNENYARELQELFTIGKVAGDGVSAYSAADIRQAARVLSGWICNYNAVYDSRNVGLTSKFYPANHTATRKRFSAFYGNKVINQPNTEDGARQEISELITMLLGKDESALHIVRKIYRFFVYYKITPEIETTVIVPLANTFRANNFMIKPVLEELFLSQHFYDIAKSRDCMIKNPIDFAVGLARTFNMVTPHATYLSSDFANTYASWGVFYSQAAVMQMNIGSPPNVSGWAAYSNSPTYHQRWINADTLRSRRDFVNQFAIYSGFNGQFKIVSEKFTATLANPSDINALINEVLELLHPLPADASVIAALKKILLDGQTNESYWTSAWNNYMATPTNDNLNIVKPRLNKFYHAVLSMAEFHLM